MTNTHTHIGADRSSGLIHLMEAATALTQLVASAQTVPNASSLKGTLPPTSITDDDVTLTSHPSISLLRENHLKALHAASLIASQPSGDIRETVDSSKPPFPMKDKATFPMRLHAILADTTIRDIISWLPKGNSFVILRPEAFTTCVLPRYFPSEASSKGGYKYPSFTRKLNRWGFRQISRGADAGAFYHELFCRDEPEACRRIVCKKSRNAHKEINDAASSANTSITSGEKRSASATVTVSTSGSLPFKKRRGMPHNSRNDTSGIPANVEMKPNNSSLVYKSASANSDETVSGLSNDESVSSNQAKAGTNHQGLSTNQSKAEEEGVLARHFYEQHRAFALASLMENSRKAMIARGLDVNSFKVEAKPSASFATTSRSNDAVTKSEVPAHPATISQSSSPPATKLPNLTTAEEAKIALYEAYKKALASSS